MTIASVMFVESSRSRTHGGTGTIIRTTRATEAAATHAWEVEPRRSRSPGRAGAAVATRSRSPRWNSDRPERCSVLRGGPVGRFHPLRRVAVALTLAITAGVLAPSTGALAQSTPAPAFGSPPSGEI